MALKTWIDEIKTDGSGEKSEALLKQDQAPVEVFLPGEKEADIILFGARDRIVSCGVFHWTPETQVAEAEVNQAYKAILAGGHNFAALRDTCARWAAAAHNKTL